MGYWKERLLEASEGGLVAGAADDKSVCADCFRDESLRAVVADAIGDETCSFCGATSEDGVAAPLEAVVDHVSQCIHQHYEDAANSLPYESAEGGYQGPALDTWEVLDEMGLEDAVADGRDDLVEAIRDSFEMATWCEIDPFALRPHERLSYSWERFCEFVKHERRFFFLSGESYVKKDEVGDRLFDPGEILKAIAKHCMELGLVRPVSAGTSAYRVRRQTGSRPFESATDLGAPPPKVAVQTNRMSPPGVVMTYLAEDERTALRETADRGRHRYAIGEFALTREVPVLDLTAVPPVPSMFDLGMASVRDAVRFLRAFARDLSKPIARDDRVHVEYIPSQVVTEYVRVAPQLRDAEVQGLRYASARRKGGVCLVLFGGREILELKETERAALEPEERRAAGDQATSLRLTQSRRVIYSRTARRKAR
jgi:hypothetical protein